MWTENIYQLNFLVRPKGYNNPPLWKKQVNHPPPQIYKWDRDLNGSGYPSLRKSYRYAHKEEKSPKETLASKIEIIKPEIYGTGTLFLKALKIYTLVKTIFHWNYFSNT